MDIRAIAQHGHKHRSHGGQNQGEKQPCYCARPAKLGVAEKQREERKIGALKIALSGAIYKKFKATQISKAFFYYVIVPFSGF